jgi:hypothetical protein
MSAQTIKEVTNRAKILSDLERRREYRSCSSTSNISLQQTATCQSMKVEVGKMHQRLLVISPCLLVHILIILRGTQLMILKCLYE